MYCVLNRLAVFSIVTLASLGQVSAQQHPVEIPAAAVRQIMIDESCPNRSARGYGERLESMKHKICLALALHAIGCMPDPRGQSNPNIYSGLICFHELYGSRGMWPDERMVGILLGGHISRVKFPELVRSRPQSPLHLRMMAEQSEQQGGDPSTIQDPERLEQDILRPFESGAKPVKGSTTFAESFGVELVSDSAGDWRIGRVAVGSAAWFAFNPLRSYTGKPSLVVRFKPVGGSRATFVACNFDYCLDDVAAQLVVDDEVELSGVDPSLSFGRVTPPGAPWVNWSDRMDGEQDRFYGQVAFSRTGLLFGDAPDGSLVVIAIDPESPSASSGLEVGDTIERHGTRDTGESFVLPRPAHRMHAFLAEEGHALSIAARGDGAVKQLTIQRFPGGVRFHDGVAIFDANEPIQYASRVDRQAVEQERLAEESKLRDEEVARRVKEAFSGPSKEGIRDAVQRDLDFHVALVDNSARAIVRSVSLDRCAMIGGGLALCRYTTKVDFPSRMSNWGDFLKMAISMRSGATKYTSFKKTSKGWDVVQRYTHCDLDRAMGGDMINCVTEVWK